MNTGPSLSPAQAEAVAHRGSDLQIIACAGSGKTETISRRAASLVAGGVDPAGIVAFTFTEKAGAELKERIYRRCEELLGTGGVGRIAPLFVGTIHGWCFRILQERVPRFGDYEIIDEHRHAAFLSREARNLGLKELGNGRHWAGIRTWERIVDLAGNELFGEEELREAGCLERWQAYTELLDRFRYLTFSRVIGETIAALENPATAEGIRSSLVELIVDEYQDVNPAQERLIQLLTVGGARLTVVGDDDQAIYQWRGADVGNILDFKKRRPEARRIELLENRRSLPDIIAAASRFAEGIEGRIPKAMLPVREGSNPAVHLFKAEDDVEEAEIVAGQVARLKAAGFAYGDCAILLRSVRNAGAPFFDALKARGIPYEAGGRTGLFSIPAVDAMGETYAYLCGLSWRDGAFGPQRDPDLGVVSAKLLGSFIGPAAPNAEDLAAYVRDWKRFYDKLNTKSPDLVADYYRFLDFLGFAGSCAPGRPAEGLAPSLARFSTILDDYEHAARRGRDHDEAKGQVYRAGLDRGKAYWFGLGTYLAHYAAGSYDDAAGEPEAGGEAVRVLTVHQAKGLEWPVVFLPSLVEGRFPSGRNGEEEEWPFPESVFPLEKRLRYAGTDADERLLFYVAMTRARDALYASTFTRRKRAFKPSSFFLELERSGRGVHSSSLPMPEAAPIRPGTGNPVEELAFSDLALWSDCGERYRFSKSLGFEQSLVEELGYGHAIHHALRAVAEVARASGAVPSTHEAQEIAKAAFYAPYADEGSRERMLAAAGRIVEAYVRNHSGDLRHAWALEHPFELHLPSGTVTGRADLIIDESEGKEERLALVDYKLTSDPGREERYAWQLQVYALAGKREGKPVAAAYLHALKDGSRQEVALGEQELAEAEKKATAALTGIRAGDFPPRPGCERCGSCDFISLCMHRDPAIEPRE